MRTLGILVAGVGIVIGTILGMLFKGDLDYCFACAGVLLLIATIAWPIFAKMISKDRQQPGLVRQGTKIIFGCCVFLSVSLPISIVVGKATTKRQVSEAKQFVSMIVPKVDQYRRETGRFPTDIVAVHTGPMPSLLGSDGGYKSDGTDFRFLIYDRTGWAKFHIYRSNGRQWELTDHVGFFW